MKNHYRLVISCPDRVGIVAAVSQFLNERQGSIVEASHHTDPEQKWFFMRHVIDAESLNISVEEFREQFAPIADQFDMTWYVNDSADRPKVMLLATKESHCLNDILHRWHTGELSCDIVGVIANHEELRSMVEWYKVPYHCIQVPKEDKMPAFQAIEKCIDDSEADTIVLARYMQIFPEYLCEKYRHRVINIHHSFLPSFIGAKPYHQAAVRGVKLIGATCHYVTADLDAGPIIEQDVIRVRHSHTAADMVRLGKDIEKLVLSRGLRYHLEDRVLVHGNKTVVFSE
ncbi:formyltetrahydrofolate deformylase [Marinomonas mediterranea]|jgi:formyltetrahydrofolate deformylase|uniref:Formyltetrahydrofolate deformylase n=1 Tax=Marinomonas mediterranea (strain ATCC 700492 / JCM 21426 / NBRC 103028 / MMB-1) TaxID=717774 RepID=F2JWM9_MARM1|nr:formyltetrahydrofolate deformylase [Marinomonas mediterranea]ADZ91793.1 formyltetrahydrofolate deformylase [Marinomonas mediterranea MMB-1]WCN09748.1 formyltetrahydrofolate deformylase [Marinomonas mediterranea]WCN13830.1 formyltetrahydrofolate deformylase [Marinomonas mediterranea]WCN17886.1 formyltetrahydrofolate deformylase [Marinomonas mediterranea MMB-1]